MYWQKLFWSTQIYLRVTTFKIQFILYYLQYIPMEVIDKIYEDEKCAIEDMTAENLKMQTQVEETYKLNPKSYQKQTCNSNRVRNPQTEITEADLISKKAATAKLKFRKLKQRISNMCYKHEDVATGKEVTSTNKLRIMKLSIQLEKHVNNQVKDYNNIEMVMKEILKILEQKRENDPYNKRQNDLHILRQSKCIPSIMEFCKKLLSLYKSQFRERIKLIEIINRILLIFSTSATNRQYLIITNRIPTLTSLLITLLKRQQTSDLYLISNLYNLITSLLDHKLEGQHGCFIEQTVQYLHQCSIIKKTFSLLQTLVEDGSFTSEHLVKSSFKFLTSVFLHTDHLCQMRPIQEISNVVQSSSSMANIELTLTFLNQYSQLMIPDKESIERTLLDGDLPVSSISNMLLIIQGLYLCCKLSLEVTQKNIGNQTLMMIAFVLRYSKQFCEQSEDLKQLLNRVIVLIGYLAFQNQDLQNRINQCHIISDLCNLPTKFIVDKKSIQVLVPTLCCLVHHNSKNIQAVFQDLSTVYVKKFLKTQMHIESNQQKSIGGTPGLLTRKSSLSSMTSVNTQSSSIISYREKEPSLFRLKMRFPVKYWSQLLQKLSPLQ